MSTKKFPCSDDYYIPMIKKSTLVTHNLVTISAVTSVVPHRLHPVPPPLKGEIPE